MGVGQGRHILVLVGKFGQQSHHAHQLLLHQRKTFLHHQHVGVIAHIAAGGAQMDDALGVGALQAIGVHMAHHVVAAFLFPADGILIVDVVLVGFQLGNLLVGDVQAIGFFGLGQSNPQPAPGAELVVLREDVLHLGGGITGLEGRDVFIVGHSGSPFSGFS